MSITHFILYSWVSLILSHYYVSPILRKTLKISFQCYYDRCLIAANSLGLVFIPILVLVVLNCMIFRTINKATQRHNAISTHQRRDHSVAMMLILIGTFDHNLNSLEWLLCINIKYIRFSIYSCFYFNFSNCLCNMPFNSIDHQCIWVSAVLSLRWNKRMARMGRCACSYQSFRVGGELFYQYINLFVS